ncbi:MAG: DUF58 domain-containing protein, partial [Kiritimatiellae bacterium]|nr:DUF58 domain-containing protein [Kiritimatiellia bacterium]
MPDYFDPRVISRVKGLEVRSMRLVESHMAGVHRSRLRGISTEFAQHRQYVIGDDLRHLDWKVYAKTDRLFVKEYEAETNMPVYFLLDASPSMFFKSEENLLSKYEYGATIVATVAYLLTQQKDTFALVLFGEKPRTILPAKGSGGHYRNMLDLMSRTAANGAEGKTDIGAALMAAAPIMKNRGIVMLISDLVDDTEKLGRGLGQLSFMGQDVVLFHIEDAVERDFPFVGQTIFRGLEGEGKLLCNPEDLREAYLRERAKHLDSIREVCMRFSYEVVDIANDTRLDVVPVSYT